ncbi:MAG: ASPIC/UnbV domain-containing protein [Akkermansiaceae bacterium]
MSQSPINDFSKPVVDKYKHRWGALARLLNSDRSFSGREKHTAFLNLGGERFVDISAVTGFDFAEDGRALIAQDWDFDGDLDIWVTARTAPRVRLLQNDSNNAGESLFIRLHGNGKNTNTDAIGARCEVWLKNNDKPITRSLKAGDSFLTQSGSWLHFGLGNKAEISQVIVHWPAGKKEKFSGLKSGVRYLIHQGEPLAKPWKPHVTMAETQAPTLVLPDESAQARIVPLTPKLLPLLQTKDGKAIEGSDLKGPVLVNLWSKTCLPCLAELKEWTSHASEFQKAELSVVALNVDSITDPDSIDAEKFLKNIKFPYVSHSTNEDTLQRLDLFQRSFLDRWIPIPVPCSFLLDKKGRVAVIYKGTVSSETILADIALLGAQPEILRNAATPFSGLWASSSPFVGPKSYITQLLDHKKIDDVERYYQRYLTLERTNPNPPTAPMVEALKVLSTIASQRKDFNNSVAYLKESVALVPQAPDLRALLKQEQDKAEKALGQSVEGLLAKVTADPKNGKAHLALADAYRNSGEPVKAVESYKNALRTDPDIFVAAGKLAWLLATHPDPQVRHPKMALGIANKLMSMSNGKDPNYFDLKAIALAANGDYPAAIENANSALKLLQEDSPYKRGINSRLLLYQQGKPYYEKTGTK